MKLARYVGEGKVQIVGEAQPTCPEGGLLIKTEACGLCSGELMDWYMDSKVPHVLGHEVAGKVVESQCKDFPIGSRVFPHHHAPCMECLLCKRGLFVHCPQWKGTKLNPGGMAESFAVSSQNLGDTLLADDLRSIDAALIEPLACVMKGLSLAGYPFDPAIKTAVIGLGSMGLMHMLMLPGAVGIELNRLRLEYAQTLDMDARRPEGARPSDVVFVCPGNPDAINLGLKLVNPGGTVILFAPTTPGTLTEVDFSAAYFKEAKIIPSYSCGPEDTRAAAAAIRAGKLKAEQVVSNFIGLNELPHAYKMMKAGTILKAMVVFE